MLHKDLYVWKQSIELVASIYDLTKQLPAEETYGMCSQMKRAAVSIPSNIAEGAARKGTRDYLKFLNIASGSLTELETLLILSERLYRIPIENLIDNELTPVKKMLNRLQSTLRKRVD